MSHGVVALLDQETEERVRALRQQLAEVAGTASLDALPLPHLSLVVSEGVDEDAVVAALERAATHLRRVPVLAEPWTVFLAPPPSDGCAVVRSVTRTPALDELRRVVVAEVGDAMQGISAFTTSESWNPHVTLASRGITPARLGTAVDHLVRQAEPPWHGCVERLALVVEEGTRNRLAMAVELTP